MLQPTIHNDTGFGLVEIIKGFIIRSTIRGR